MPVHVDVPVRVRVDSAALGERLDDLAAALGAATGRALASSSGLVGAPRGGYARVRLDRPSFRWLGDGAHTVSPGVRLTVEGRLSEVLAACAPVASAGPIVPPLSQPAAEPVQDDRLVALLGRYLVPTYASGSGAPRAVPIDEADAPASPPVEVVDVWKTSTSLQQTAAWFDQELLRRGLQRPASGYLGAIFRNAPARTTIAIYRYPGETLVLGRELFIGRLSRYQAVADGRQTHFERSVFELPAGGSYQLRWFARADDRAAVRAFHRAYIEEVLRGLGWPPAGMAPDEYERGIEELVDQAVEPVDPAAVCLLELIVDDTERFLIQMPFDLPHDLDCVLLPLVDRVLEEPATPILPGAPGASRILQCVPFELEPSLVELGADADRLRGQISYIAGEVGIEQCEYAGQFCLNAATAWRSLVSRIAEYAVTDEASTVARPGGGGVLGLVDFAPSNSAAIDALRRLGELVPHITELSRAIETMYGRPEHRGKLGGRFKDEPVSWMVRFGNELSWKMTNGSAEHFAQTCRVLLLQLLRASHRAIEARANNDAYAAMFEDVVLMLVELDDLYRLRDDLLAAVPAASAGAAMAETAVSTWREAWRVYYRALEGRNPIEPPSTPSGDVIIFNADGTVRGILDHRDRLWTLAALEQAIAFRRGMAEDVDPIVKQLTDLPFEMERFRADASTIRPRLAALLTEMLGSNEDITREVESDPIYAFRIGHIRKDLEHATVPGTEWPLEGIRLEAYRAVGDSFHGDAFYGLGIGLLFGAELGRQDLLNFFGFVGEILLAVACPPLAVYVGLAQASQQYLQAYDQWEIYRGLIDPEVLVNYAEIEAEFFAAQLGLAFAFIEVPGMVRGGIRGARTVGRAVSSRGVAGGARLASRMAARNLVREMASQIKDGVVRAMLKEMAQDQVMGKLIGSVLEPVMVRLERELAVTGPVGGSSS